MKFFRNGSRLGPILLTFYLGMAKSSFGLTIPQHVPIPEQPSIGPQIQWIGTGIATLKPIWASNSTPNSTIDFTDSTLVFAASQALYGNGEDRGIGSFVFGTLMTDQSTAGTGLPLFVHQAYVTYQAKWFEAYIGRTENPISQIVDLPTIRADDLISFTSYLNPFSSSTVVQEHRYSNIASVTLNHNLETYANFHVQHLIHSKSVPGQTEFSYYGTGNADVGIDSYGLTIEHLGSLLELESLSRVQLWGLGYERVPLKDALDHVQNVLYAGGIINLNKSVTNRIELRFQDVLTLGNQLSGFQTLSDTFAANSNLFSLGIRYLNSPFGTPGYQLGLTTGYRSYFGIPNSASLGTALTGAKRLGMGFDLVGQYIFQWRDTTLANQYSGNSFIQSVEIGLVYNFNSGFNEHLNLRRSLLNTRYGYNPN